MDKSIEDNNPARYMHSLNWRIAQDPNIKKILPVSTTCNNNCIFCSTSGALPRISIMLTLEQIKTELKKAKEKGSLHVVFTGGEPTIHKEIIEAVSYAKSLGYCSISIVTNGRMLSYPSFAKAIIEAGLTEAIFSIHGPNAEIHDRVTGVPGSFDQLLAGLKNVSKYTNVVVSADTTVINFNYKYLPQTIQLMIDNGIKTNINIVGLWLINKAYSNKELIMPDYTKLKPYLEAAIKLMTENRIVFFVNRYPPRYMEDCEKYFPMIHANPHDLAIFVKQFKNADTPRCKGEKCYYCELNNLCSELTHLNRNLQDKRKPGLAQIFTGDMCDNDCPSCLLVPRKDKLLELKDLKKQIQIAERYGAVNIEIIGGEPTLHPELIKLIKYAKLRRFKKITLKTNGRHLTPEYAGALKIAGLTNIRITFHSSKAEKHDLIAGVSGSHTQTLEGMDSLSGLFELETDTLITELNCSDLPSLSLMLKAKGVRNARFSLLNPHSLIHYGSYAGIMRYEDVPRMIPSLNKVGPMLARSKHILGKKLFIEDVPLCASALSEKHTNKFVLKPWLLSKDYKEQFVNITIDLVKRVKLKRLSCADCVYSNRCDGLYQEYVRIKGFKVLKPQK